MIKTEQKSEFDLGMQYVVWLLEEAYKDSTSSVEFANKVREIIRKAKDES
jgi:hypothetical protein